MVADNPNRKIERKAFHCEILNDHDALEKERIGYQDIPLIRTLDNASVQCNYEQIRREVQDMIHSELEILLNNPEKAHLALTK